MAGPLLLDHEAPSNIDGLPIIGVCVLGGRVRMMKKTVLAALLAFVMLPAYAEQWKLVEVSENHTLHFMDENTITRQGATVEYWEKSVFPDRHYTAGHIAYHAVKRQYLAQCRQESQVPVKQVFYDAEGHVVGQVETPPGVTPQGRQVVIPGSYQEWMLEYACHPPAPAVPDGREGAAPQAPD